MMDVKKCEELLEKLEVQRQILLQEGCLQIS